MDNKEIIAITGPSGSGKTTIASLLCENLGGTIPVHCTTRKQRKDDAKGFYKYLSHDDFSLYLNENSFLVASGDNEFVSKENGNFYGILFEDFNKSLLKSDLLIIFVSYKDIYRLKLLKEVGINIDIINLTFSDIELGIRSRIENNCDRNHSINDVENRIRSAREDSLKYGEEVWNNSTCNIFTDLLSVEETFNTIINCLQDKNSFKKNYSKKIK